MTRMKGQARLASRWAGAIAFMFAVSGLAQAQTAKERELEARIEQLEQRVRELQKSEPQAAAAPAAAPVTASAAAPAGPDLQTKSITPNAVPGTRFSYSGYFKLDGLFSDYDDGEIADGSIGRDFYLPGTIPVGAPGESADFDSHVKQTRLIFGTDTDLPDGRAIASRAEFDLYGSSLGDERATNTYGVLLRQAYVQSGRWLFGQTWSTFQDVAALPESTDYIGPTDGTVFVRQPMVRYTAGAFSIALENPETTLTPFGGGTRISSDDNNVPDIAAAYTFKLGNGYIRTAALARQLRYQTTGAGRIEDTLYAGGLSVAGKMSFGPHDLRFMVTAGEGIGRYVGVNFNNDAVLTASGNLDAISGWAAFAAWRQAWTGALRSTFMLSMSRYDNDIALTGAAANKASTSWAVNLFYTPMPKIDLGLELRHAEREIESGAEGSLQRLHAIAKYSF